MYVLIVMLLVAANVVLFMRCRGCDPWAGEVGLPHRNVTCHLNG